MTKPSSTRKHSSSRKASKFSLLRRKLTLKKTNSPVQHNDTNGTGSQAIVVHAKITKAFQRASPMKLVRLYPKMTADQIKLIHDAGYGGLVSIKCSKLQPDLCKYLMQSFNPETCELVFPGRGRIPVNENSVYEVIGVPCGDLEVLYGIDQDAISFMNQKLGNGSKLQPTIASLEKKLGGMKKSDNNYLRLFILYGMHSVLAPNTCTFISPRLYPSLVKIKLAKRLNMAKFVIKMLLEAAKSSAEKGILKSCMLYFMVKYLDSLELEDMDVNPEGTRVSVWTNTMVHKAISQDQRSDGSFGMAPLKPEFRGNNALPDAPRHEESNSQDALQGDQEVNTSTNYDEVQHELSPSNVNYENEDKQQASGSDQGVQQEQEQRDFPQETILFSDPEIINRFMHMNVPQDSRPQDLVTYREAISEACYGFETGLQMLIRKLSQRSKEKKRRRRNKKQAAKKRKKKQTYEEIPKASDDDKDLGDSDKDYAYEEDEDEDAYNTQTTVSLVDEEFDLDDSWQNKEEKENYESRRNRLTRNPQDDDARAQNSPNSVDTQIFCSQKIMDDLVPPSCSKNNNDTSTHVHLGNVEQTSDLPVQETQQAARLVPSMIASVQTGPCNTTDEHQQEVKNTTLCKQNTARNNGKAEMCFEGRNGLAHQSLNMQSKYEAVNEDEIMETTTTERHCQLQCENQNDRGKKQDVNNGTSESDQGLSSSRILFKDLLAFARTETAPKVNMHKHLVLEPPVIFDFDMARPTRAVLRELITNMESTNTELSADVFQDWPNVTFSKEAEKLLAEMKPTYDTRHTVPRRKSVTFANQSENIANCPPKVLHSPSRIRTRADMEEMNSMPKKTQNIVDSPTNSNSRRKTSASKASPEITPRRLTRSTARLTSDLKKDDRASTPKALAPEQQLAMDSSVPKTTTPTVPSSAAHNSMNRKLNFDSSSSDRIREQLLRAPDAPPFDLGFDTETDHPLSPVNQLNDAPSLPITSSAIKEFMDLTLDSEGVGTEEVEQVSPHAKNVEELQATVGTTYSEQHTGCNKRCCNDVPSGKSITPVPHEYQKRVIKATKFQRSPYIDYATKRTFTVSKPVNELYNMVCMHGSKSKSITKTKSVIDFGTFFIILQDLADSVAPGHKLLNVACEVAIHVISGENKNSKKIIMPLRISRYLIDCRFSLKDVKNCFKFNAANRLDHKELLCFPTLECWDGAANSSGHYFLVTLNVKAQRFEIMDSITTRTGEAIMMNSCHLLIASIKKMWAKEYRASSVDISNFPIEVIQSPAQTNGFDCGFFMLKNLEEWHGRRLPWYDQADLPNIRKLSTDKWIRYHENKAEWQLIV